MARSHHSFKLRKSRHYFSVFAVFVVAILIALVIIGETGRVPMGTILSGLGLSLYRLVLAYAISLIIAVIIAVSTSGTKFGNSLIPIFDLLQNLPSFALIPLFVYLFGYTDQMAIIFAATSILWPILFYMIHALNTARKDWNDAATIFGATGWKRLWFYSLPVSFPALVTGSIVGVSVGWEAIIGVEIIGLSSGIGVFLNGAIGADKQAFAAGLGLLLFSVLLINRLVWMPLLKRTELYGE